MTRSAAKSLLKKFSRYDWGQVHNQPTQDFIPSGTSTRSTYQLLEVHIAYEKSLDQLHWHVRHREDGRSSGTTLGIYTNCEFVYYTREPLR